MSILILYTQIVSVDYHGDCHRALESSNAMGVSNVADMLLVDSIAVPLQ